MTPFETQLFHLAPWTREVLEFSKTYNNGLFMRGREGWVRRGVTNPESIYEHSCKMGLAAYYLLGIDALAPAVIHDFAEIIEPDYVPGEISKAQKSVIERQRMQELSGVMPHGDYWYVQWERFEDGAIPELFELDKMCPVIQAINYSNTRNGERLDEFYPYARKKLQTPQLIALLDAMQTRDFDGQNAYEGYFESLSQISL